MQERNKRREFLSKVALGVVSGSVIGLGIGVVHKMANKNSSICGRVADTMIIGGSYAVIDSLIDRYDINSVYRPIITGCIAGSLGSRGGPASVITSSILTAGAAYALENADIFKSAAIE
ncbi:hypothetical protein NEMIN01_2386 [Nematocida minor]|uniref:uncharacterized protein n=1 Tax=Nematocida minor TaxID=1912983 RepID=UPI00221E6800|nr:uncharacterized protein NEMIN01_2386 [Nematocida minor]KAI5193054.1 hypothetical protein NEMIN01_2386 [Nematocida minor]